MSSDAPILQTHAVSRVYGSGTTRVVAVRDASLSVWPRTLVAIAGRSGSGKTTLLNLLGALDRPTAGDILLNGRSIIGLRERECTALRRTSIGYVFQSYALIPTLSALENVTLALHIAGFGAGARRARAREVLRAVGLGDRLDHRPFELSGGEQERVALARALANRPALVLADEPTGKLDMAMGQEIIGLLKRMVESEGVSVVAATHDPAVLAAADNAYSLVDGRLSPYVPG